MDKRLVLLVIMFSICQHAFTQERVIKGTIVDEKNSPMAFVNVATFIDSVFFAGTASNENGEFCVSVEDDVNIIVLSYIGYENKTFRLHDHDMELGTIQMEPSAHTLKQLVVKAPYITRESDRIVMNVSANPLSKGSNLQELLRVAPGVWVSENSLSIYGKTGTALYIDDRRVNLSGQQLVEYLRNMRAGDIARIEIIPNAGAEYAANSPGGIIRIHMKKRTVDGLMGNVGTSLTYGKYKTWFNPNGYISVHKNKMTYSLYASSSISPRDKTFTNEQSRNSVNDKDIYGEINSKQKQIGVNLLFGSYYQINAKSRIGLEVEHVMTHKDVSILSTSSIYDTFGDSYMSGGTFDQNERNPNTNLRLSFVSALDSVGSEIRLSANYNRQKTKVRENNYTETDGARDSVYHVDNRDLYNVYTIELAYNKVASPKCGYSFGGQYTRNDVKATSEHMYLSGSEWKKDEIYNVFRKYVENIIGAYCTINFNLGRVKMKGGLRGEYYSTDNDTYSSRYFDLFPNVNISYAFSEKGNYSVSAGYYRYIQRPSFWSLSPICRQTSEYSYEEGNPDLKPSYSNALSIDFILNNRFVVACGYSKSSNAIRQMFIQKEAHPDNMYLTWVNDGNDINTFLHFDGNIDITSWWNVFINATYVNNFMQDTKFTESQRTNYVQFLANTRFALPKGFWFSANWFYQSRMRIGNIQISPIFNVSPTLQKTYKKWNFTLSAENILQRKSKIRMNSSGYDRTRATRNHMAFTLSVSYNFSSGKAFQNNRARSIIDSSRYAK